MGLEKNYGKQRNNNRYEAKKAYRPKPPFHSVEGVGTPAWEKLDLGAIGILMKFYENFNGYNRYDLSLTYKEVKNKVSSLVFTRFLWQLIGFGFIDIRRVGRLERNCSLYGISDRWRRLSEEPEVLNEIEKLLKKIDSLKRLPGNLTKRMNMWELRNNVKKLGRHPVIRQT